MRIVQQVVDLNKSAQEARAVQLSFDIQDTFQTANKRLQLSDLFSFLQALSSLFLCALFYYKEAGQTDGLLFGFNTPPDHSLTFSPSLSPLKGAWRERTRKKRKKDKKFSLGNKGRTKISFWIWQARTTDRNLGTRRGLAWETPTEEMRRYFDQFGDILEAVIITDKNTGRSKGYGFVTYRDPESARRACLDPNPVIDGRRANCNIASLGRPRPSPPRVIHSIRFITLVFPLFDKRPPTLDKIMDYGLIPSKPSRNSIPRRCTTGCDFIRWQASSTSPSAAAAASSSPLSSLWAIQALANLYPPGNVAQGASLASNMVYVRVLLSCQLLIGAATNEKIFVPGRALTHVHPRTSISRRHVGNLRTSLTLSPIVRHEGYGIDQRYATYTPEYGYSQMNKGVFMDPEKTHLYGECKAIDEFCATSWHTYRANLMRNYFYNPWAILSLAAAILLLLLTVTQTVFSIYPNV
ncbi:hypothetical protein ACLOJK_013384 [Asimina triloba]